jgi:hypothetical protein
MRFLVYLAAFTGLLPITLAATSCDAEGYIPPTATPTGHPLAVMDTYSASDCTVNDINACKLVIYESEKCYPLSQDTASLIVVESDKSKLKYNSRKWKRPISSKRC